MAARDSLGPRPHAAGARSREHEYEGSVALMWQGFVGNGLTRDGIRSELGQIRKAAFAALGEWLGAAATRPLIEGLRLALAFLPKQPTRDDPRLASSIYRGLTGGCPIRRSPSARRRGTMPVPGRRTVRQ